MSRDNLTYDQWKDAGRQVKKGERATGRNAAGRATFTLAQTKPHMDPYYYDNDWEEDHWWISADIGDR